MYSNDDTRTDILPRPNEKLPWKLRKASGMRMWPEASSKTCVNAILGILADAHLYAKHKNIFSGVSFCFCHELRQNFYHPISEASEAFRKEWWNGTLYLQFLSRIEPGGFVCSFLLFEAFLAV